jgi:hypothetical protein
MALGALPAAARTLEAAPVSFEAVLSRAQVVPAPDDGLNPGRRPTVLAQIAFDAGFTRATLLLDIPSDLRLTDARIHCALPGERGPLVVDLLDPALFFDVTGTLRVSLEPDDLVDGVDRGCVDHVGRPVPNLVALAFGMREGLIYVEADGIGRGREVLRGQFLYNPGVDVLEPPGEVGSPLPF